MDVKIEVIFVYVKKIVKFVDMTVKISLIMKKLWATVGN